MIRRKAIDDIIYRRIKLAQEQPNLLKAPDEWLIELKGAIDYYLQANGLPDTESKCNKHGVIKSVCDYCKKEATHHFCSDHLFEIFEYKKQ